jgi:hypothetical protein
MTRRKLHGGDLQLLVSVEVELRRSRRTTDFVTDRIEKEQENASDRCAARTFGAVGDPKGKGRYPRRET